MLLGLVGGCLLVILLINGSVEGILGRHRLKMTYLSVCYNRGINYHDATIFVMYII